MTIAVTGATGRVGRLVVRHVLDAGLPVRAMTRDPGRARFPASVQVVAGDLDEPESLTQAFAGVQALFLLARPATASAVARQAARCGIGRIVTLSSILADTEPPDAVGHRAVERAVEAVDVEWTHVRPGMFAANLMSWSGSIRTSGVVREPFGAARQTPIHEADIAAVAAAALVEAGHAGRKYPLTGPQALSKAEQVAAIGVGIGQALAFEEVSAADWRRENAGVVPAFAQDFLLDLWARTATRPEAVLPTVVEVTGRQARSLTEWAADHAADFGGAVR